jgi:hypothetical protein
MSQTAKNLKCMSYLVIIFAIEEAIYGVTSTMKAMNTNLVGTDRTSVTINNGVLIFFVAISLMWAVLRLLTGIKGLKILKDKSVSSPNTLLTVLLVMDVLSAVSILGYIGKTADTVGTVVSACGSVAYIIGDIFLKKYMKGYKAEA